MKKKIIYINDNKENSKKKEKTYIEKLIKMLNLFQIQRYITKEKIIEELDISERTFYRYVNKLENAGIPIQKLDNNTLTIDEEKTYLRLDRISFTQEETASFIIAHKLIENFSDYSVSSYYKGALYKILLGLKEAGKKDVIEFISNNTTSIKKTPFNTKRFPHNYLIDIQKAIVNRKTLKIIYYTYHKDEQSKREIIPVEINFYRSMWHIRAFCNFKNDYREFRLDRIEDLTVTNNEFDNNEYTIDKYLEAKKKSTPEKKIVVSFNKDIERLIYLSKFNFKIIKETNNKETIEIVFGIDKYKIDEFLRWLLMWGRNCEVIKPLKIKQELRLIVKELIEHYK